MKRDKSMSNIQYQINKFAFLFHKNVNTNKLNQLIGNWYLLKIGTYWKLSLGQSLIEMIIAMSVAVIIVISLVGLTIVSLKNSQFAKSQTTATKLTQEAMEKIRQWRDTNWTDFSSKVGQTLVVSGNCQLSPTFSCASTLSTCPIIGNEASLINSQFLRCATLADAGADQINVTVLTVWQDSAGIHQSSASSIFSNPNSWSR